jgi:Secretion system C-terminal sorting domain
MKLMKFKYYLTASLLLLFGFSNKCISQAWNYVGLPGFSHQSCTNPSIALGIDRSIYVTYTDMSSADSAFVPVFKFDGSAWNTVTSCDCQGYEACVVTDSAGNLYLAYSEAIGGKVSVMSYNGSSWSVVGTSGFSAGPANDLSLTIDEHDSLYVSFEDLSLSRQVVVMKFNGTSWAYVGSSSGISPGQATRSKMTIGKNDIPYVIFADISDSAKAVVMKYNAGTWTTIASNNDISSSGIYFPDITADAAGNVYVMGTNADNNNAFIDQFNGTSWVPITPASFAVNLDVYANQKGTAMSATGHPYFVFLDSLSDINMIKYSGSSWSMVGSHISTQGGPMSMVLDANDSPYVCFEDPERIMYASVMTEAAPSFVHEISTAIQPIIYPNPSNGTFTIKFDQTPGNDLQIKITDVLGNRVPIHILALSNPNERSIVLNVTSGIYFITATTGCDVFNSRIIVEK